MITWIVQKNLTNPKVLALLKSLAQKHGFGYEEITVIPFSEQLDYELKQGVTPVFYGSTTLMLTAYCDLLLRKGIFYDDQKFSIQNYLTHWKEANLNFDSQFFSITDILNKDRFSEELYFLRPDGDTKLFAGTVMSLQQFKEGISLVLDSNPQVTEETIICASPVKKIEKEWRNFIVNKKVVSSARYAILGEVSVDASDVPSEMVSFAEEQCQIYTPTDIFVMDIALVNGAYKIVECNCFNATGFYDYDIETIVLKINEHLSKQ